MTEQISHSALAYLRTFCNSRCLYHTYFSLVDHVFINNMASKIPKVVTFGYDEFEVINDRKWRAKCKHCGEKITETRGTSSGFTKHLERKHSSLYADYKKSKS